MTNDALGRYHERMTTTRAAVQEALLDTFWTFERRREDLVHRRLGESLSLYVEAELYSPRVRMCSDYNPGLILYRVCADDLETEEFEHLEREMFVHYERMTKDERSEAAVERLRVFLQEKCGRNEGFALGPVGFDGWYSFRFSSSDKRPEVVLTVGVRPDQFDVVCVRNGKRVIIERVRGFEDVANAVRAVHNTVHMLEYGAAVLSDFVSVQKRPYFNRMNTKYLQQPEKKIDGAG